MRVKSLWILAGFALCASAAWAQDTSALLDRIGRMERDITFLQRQIYRGASVDPNAPSLPAATAGGISNLQTQISQMQEELRGLRGSVEAAQYQARRAESELKKLSEDVEFRLLALERANTEREEEKSPESESGFSPDAGREDTSNIEEPARYTPKDASAAPPASNVATQAADAEYNKAFALLNKKDYAKAAENFSGFIRKFPSDPLVPNAYYWLGESYYARGDYVRAIDQFRKGFEAAPTGQKAADNLLKLGMSLSNVKRTKEACVVLSQVSSKYKKSASAATLSRAEDARAQLKCS